MVKASHDLGEKNQEQFMKTVYIVLLLTAMTYGFSETSDSLSLEKRIVRLEQKIDSLQVAVAKYTIKRDEDNPFKSAGYLEWGRGVTLQIQGNVYTGIEAGYTFLTIRHYRLGIFAGTDFLTNGTHRTLPNMDMYAKTSLGTPILLNFISVNAYIKTIYFPEGILSDLGKHVTSNMGVAGNGGRGSEAGLEAELWMSSHICFLFGFCQRSGSDYGFSSGNVGLRYAFGTLHSNTKKRIIVPASIIQ
jgi:hypothetical protein